MALLKNLLKRKPDNEDQEEYIVDEETPDDESEEQELDRTEEELVLDSETEEVVDESGEEGQLALDVFQDKNNIVIRSTIAGVKPEDLDITVATDMVTIKGERKQEYEVEEDDYFYKECYWGSFSRSLPLPVEVDVDKTKAEIKDGVLTLTLPKALAARTKKVKVKGAE